MTGHAVTLAARAKVNLILRVLEREEAGFHQIETVFQRLALADDVAVRITDGSESLDVRWDGAPSVDLGPVEQNLAWRAAAAYRKESGWPRGWGIELTKRIPAGAGLGGGSADAAAVLRAFDKLAASPLGVPRLLSIAGALGADVPFLTSDHTLAIGRGYGERLRSVPALPAAPVLIAVPPFGISTAEAYEALAGARALRARGVRSSIIRNDDDFSDWPAVAARQVNDFEQTVFDAHADLATYRDAMESSGALIARLCGSGSALFGLWAPGSDAKPPAPPKGWRLVKTSTM